MITGRQGSYHRFSDGKLDPKELTMCGTHELGLS